MGVMAAKFAIGWAIVVVLAAAAKAKTRRPRWVRWQAPLLLPEGCSVVVDTGNGALGEDFEDEGPRHVHLMPTPGRQHRLLSVQVKKK